MKNGVELWLVRHGESEFSAGKRVAGWSDPPLTARGRRQAAALRELVDGHEFTGVWSSDLVRSLETARLAWGEPQIDRRLRECHFGSLEGRVYEDVDSVYGEVFHRFRGFQAPGGESHAAFRGRIVKFVDELEAGRHLLVVHGGVIRVLSQDLGVDRFVSTGSVVALDWGVPSVLWLHEPGNTGSDS